MLYPSKNTDYHFFCLDNRVLIILSINVYPVFKHNLMRSLALCYKNTVSTKLVHGTIQMFFGMQQLFYMGAFSLSSRLFSLRQRTSICAGPGFIT